MWKIFLQKVYCIPLRKTSERLPASYKKNPIVNYANNMHWGWTGKKPLKIHRPHFLLHSSVFNVSLWFSKFIGELLFRKLGPKLSSGFDQSWEARTPMGEAHQQQFLCEAPEQGRGDAIGCQIPSSAGRGCYEYCFPSTLESNQVLLCPREAAAPCQSCHSAFSQKRKTAFMQWSSNFWWETATEVPLSCDSLLGILNIV